MKNTDSLDIIIEDVTDIIETAYYGGHQLQFVRELAINADEAFANRLEWDIEWQGAKKRIYRLQVSDNGIGMNPEQLLSHIRTMGKSSKIKIKDSLHNNFGLGGRVSTLPWNQYGLIYISYTKEYPNGNMIWIYKNPSTGRYGAKQLENKDGDFSIIVEPWDDSNGLSGIDFTKIKPDFVESKGSGTIVIFLGNTGKENTFVTKGLKNEKDLEFGVLGIRNYLEERLYNVSNNFKGKNKGIFCRFLPKLKIEDIHLWPTRKEQSKEESTGGRFNYMNKITPVRDLIKEFSNDINIEDSIIEPIKPKNGIPKKQKDIDNKKNHLLDSGIIVLKDKSELYWYLWDKEKFNIKNERENFAKGFIASLYKDELYDRRENLHVFKTFGIPNKKLSNNITIIIKPLLAEKGGYGIHSDTSRNSLRIMDGSKTGLQLPWEVWAEEFAENIPKEICMEILNNAPISDVSLYTDEDFQRIIKDNFGDLMKMPLYKQNEKGIHKINVDDDTKLNGGNGGGGGGTEDPENDDPENKTKKIKTTDTDEKGDILASKHSRNSGYPKCIWSNDVNEFEGGYAANWTKPTIGLYPCGLITLNRDFEEINERIKYYKSKNSINFHSDIEKIITSIIAFSMSVRVANITRLKKISKWSIQRIEGELLSPEALTSSVMSLYAEHYLIEESIKKHVSKNLLISNVIDVLKPNELVFS